MKVRASLSFLLISVTAASFAVGNSDHNSIGVPDAAWKTPKLKACWQNSRSQVAQDVADWAKGNYNADVPPESFRKLFAGWVRSAYSVARVGIEFDGFGECPENTDLLADYPVYLVNNMELTSAFMHFLGKTGERSTIGIGVIGDRNRYYPERTRTKVEMKPSSSWPLTGVPAIVHNKYPYKAAVGFDFSAWDPILLSQFVYIGASIESMLGFDPGAKELNETQKLIRQELKNELELQRLDSAKFTALHELGHLVGLLHEDRRRDAKAARPKYCLNVAGDDGHENNGALPLNESLFGTAYDPFSIMSYCRETMHHLYHQARLVCRLAPKFSKNLRASIASFLKNCDDVEKLEFPVDLTPRDVNSLRQMYLHEAPGTGGAQDFRKAPAEVRLYEILDATARLPFDGVTARAMRR